MKTYCPVIRLIRGLCSLVSILQVNKLSCCIKAIYVCKVIVEHAIYSCIYRIVTIWVIWILTDKLLCHCFSRFLEYFLVGKTSPLSSLLKQFLGKIHTGEQCLHQYLLLE